MRLLLTILATSVLSLLSGLWIAGHRGAIILFSVSTLIWVFSALRGRAVIYRAMGVTSLRLPSSLRNTWARVEEVRGEKIAEELVISPELVPDALFFMTLTGRRHLVLTEGLIRGLSESEIRVVLNRLADSLLVSGIRTSSISAFWSFWFWKRIPESCRTSLFQGKFSLQVSPWDVFRTLLIHPLMVWFLPRVQRARQQDQNGTLDDAMQKMQVLRTDLQARRPSCWDALSLFESHPLFSAFELGHRQR